MARRTPPAGSACRTPTDLSVAVAVGQLLPRRRLGPPRRRAGRAASWPQRCRRAGRRRLRAPPPLRRRARARTPALWGRADASTITQPPMYGHAVAVLTRLGMPSTARSSIERARRGLRFLLERRRRTAGGPGRALPPVGVGLRRQPAVGRRRARRPHAAAPGTTLKGSLVGSIERGPGGAPLAQPGLRRGVRRVLGPGGLERAGAGRGRPTTTTCAVRPTSWPRRSTPGGIAELATWVDDGPTASGSGRVRTLDALLPLLVCDRPEAVRGRSPTRPRSARRAVPAACTSPSRPTTPTHLLARPRVAAAHLPALAGDQVGVRPHGRRLPVEVDGGRRRSRPGSRSTGWPTRAEPWARCPRPGRPSPSWWRSGPRRPPACDLATHPAAAQLPHDVGDAEGDDEVAEGHDLVRGAGAGARRRARRGRRRRSPGGGAR